ncbi:hypothetical protein [Pseudoponticoccus marisrubri]|uniref:Thioredoxin domain-containing protein n=1 Tax=Pseudoponticoccus marisrubri TaxID=1685382 RepID=A0A0W7WM87_9RHOB|nr:hypothetical protein [Pseudoponticoccus marisrubri]KUF11604.1 hypothetical protein AVJ23_07560 [Pseudoponticoccus marisrubri]
MIRAAGLLLCLATSPATAGEASELRARLKALAGPSDPYAAEKAADLNRIAADAPRLFGADGAGDIALFVGPDCADCPAAQESLQALAAVLDKQVRILDISDPANSALMQRMTLDTVPSYVMPDKLIRGAMPRVVLERYLTEN